MTTERGGTSAEQKSAAERIEEARRLNRSISETLDRILSDLSAGDMSELRDVSAKQKQLENALSSALRLEIEFNDKFGTGLAEGEIDFEQVRFDIGCRLARLRRCCREEGLSEGPDPA